MEAIKSSGLQLALYNQRNEIAPDALANKIVEFEVAVANLRIAQKHKKKWEHLAKIVDDKLDEMSYYPTDLF